MATVSELLKSAAAVKSASADGENTALRVGSLFIGIIELMSDAGLGSGFLSEAEAETMAKEAVAEALSKFDV